MAAVYYAHADSHRRFEARSCAAAFGFTALFEVPTPDELLTYSRVYLPAITDSHPQHKAMNRMWRGAIRALGIPLSFYSVDLQDNPHKVGLVDADHKRLALNSVYPSQSDLWETNASYYLFEAIRETDIDVKTKVTVQLKGAPLDVWITGTLANGMLRTDQYASETSLCDDLVAAGASGFMFETPTQRYTL